MKRRDIGLLVMSFLAVGGSVAAHLSLGVYLNSNAYRVRVEQAVGAFFDLPCDIAAAHPLTFSSKVYEGVRIWLPDRRDRIFECSRAVWREYQVDGAPAVNLDLIDGTIAFGTDKWHLEDYRRVLESALGGEMDELRRVRLDGFEISFRRRDLLLSCAQAAGTIDYETPEVGIVSLEAYVFNGRPVREPIRVHARFQPSGDALIEHMIVAIPEVELAALGLDAAVGGNITRGRFSGRLEFHEARPQARLTISGRAYNIDLAQL
ncbi:MAG: hypothetical protein V3T70_06155, partial [Phycisphaerae bacterium]